MSQTAPAAHGLAAPKSAALARRSTHLMGNPWYGLVPVLGYLLLFYLIPLLYLLSLSFRVGQGSGLQFSSTLTLANYGEFFASQANWIAWARSFGVAFAVVILSIFCAYPLAYTIAFLMPKKYQQVTLLLIIAPFWTSFIIRAFAWQLLLADAGPINTLLQQVGLPPFKILYTHAATIAGLTVFGTMLITLNLYATMENINPNLLAAAADLGARRWQGFREVILPLSFPGMIIGATLTFITAFGDFIVPALLGGGIRLLLAQAMVGAITTNFNIPRAATYAMLMLLSILIITLPMLRLARRGLNEEG